MSQFHELMPHGSIEKIFEDVFFVTGTMRNEFFGSMWQFSRNMTIIREGDALTIINSVRLDEKGLKDLDALGKVKNLVRIGDMHGVDDPFYKDRYNAKFWALPAMGMQEMLNVDQELVEGGELPFSGARFFAFQTTSRPEGILILEREGGIAIACDALQNWESSDEFIDASTTATMTKMNFFKRANLGPAWIHECNPQSSDFVRLKEISFEHALCGHGKPLLGGASKAYHRTIQDLFKV